MSRACIPFYILFDKDLSKNELIIYGLIEHMESNGKNVFFNNRTIAEKLGVSHESRIVGKMLANLKKKQYICREHKEITFRDKQGNEKKVTRWCLSTVKAVVISNESDDENMVPEIPPLKVVPEIPQNMVPEVPPYNTPDLITPLTTTTQSSSVFNKEIDQELIDLRTQHIPNDERTVSQFLKQCKWHVDSGSKDHTFNQRLGGLKKIIKGCVFDIPKGYPSQETKGKSKEQNLERLRNEWLNYYNSRVEKRCREAGYESKTFEEYVAYVSR